MAVVLGSGLGDFADDLEDAFTIPYADIPHWPASRVIGHAGKLVGGTVRGSHVLVLSGRVHAYEGHDMQTVTFAMRVMGRLGVTRVILTNAAGGISPNCSRGALMVIDDHINLMGQNPLVGPNDERFGLRFPDMTHVYSPALRALADERRARRGCRFSTVSTSPCWARATKRRRRSAPSGRWAPMPSACRPRPKPSSRATWASRCWEFRASPTPRPACFRSRCITTR